MFERTHIIRREDANASGADNAGGGGGTPPAGGGAPPPGQAAGGGTPPPPAGNWYDAHKFITDDPVNVNIAKKYTSLESALQGGMSASKMIGYEKIPIPKAEADWENWYRAAGRPDDASSYELKPPEALPEGMVYDKDLENSFRAAAHSAGLNGRQAEALQKFWMENASKQFVDSQKAYTTARVDAENELKRELGNGYEGYVVAAKAALSEYADPKFVEFLESSGLGNHPEVVRIFGKIGRTTLGDDKLKGIARGDAGMTPGELDAQIAEHRSKYATSLYDKTHPEHATAVAKLTTLMQLKFPQQKQV